MNWFRGWRLRVWQHRLAVAEIRYEAFIEAPYETGWDSKNEIKHYLTQDVIHARSQVKVWSIHLTHLPKAKRV